MTDICRLKYTGDTPGADSNTYNLFTTVSAQFGSNFFAHAGVSKFVLFLKGDATETGTLKEYASTDGGTTWNQVSQTAVTLGTYQDAYEFVVEPYRDWKLDWVNGGAAKTTWEVNFALVNDRGATS